jgi:tetratricopeptide (TPR) repeat protein
LEWLHARRRPLVIGAVIVAVIGLAWGIFSWKKAQNESDANAQLCAVSPEGTRMGLVSSAPLLEVAKEYPGTAAGEHARLLAAEELFTQGDYPDAGKQFSDFVNNYPDSALLPQAKVGIAACLEAGGKTTEAIAKYHEIVLSYPSEMSIISPAKLTLARLHEEVNQPQEALGLYAELARMAARNPYDPWAAEARERAQLLVSKHPELMKTLAGAAENGSPEQLSIPGAAKAPAANARPAPKASQAPSSKQAVKLLTMPGVSSNSAGKH